MSTELNGVGLLEFLWRKFDTEKASDDELSFISAASEYASVMARNFSATVSGVGCLVSSDLQSTEHRCCALQGDSLPDLLFNVSAQLQTIADMTYIGSEADCAIKQRLTARAAKTPRRAQTDQDSSKERA